MMSASLLVVRYTTGISRCFSMYTFSTKRSVGKSTGTIFRLRIKTPSSSTDFCRSCSTSHFGGSGSAMMGNQSLQCHILASGDIISIQCIAGVLLGSKAPKSCLAVWSPPGRPQPREVAALNQDVLPCCCHARCHGQCVFPACVCIVTGASLCRHGAMSRRQPCMAHALGTHTSNNTSQVKCGRGSVTVPVHTLDLPGERSRQGAVVVGARWTTDQNKTRLQCPK